LPLVERFDTPGSLRDAPAGSALYDAWHRRGYFFAPPVSAIADLLGGYGGHLGQRPARRRLSVAKTWRAVIARPGRAGA
jgi:hypothetical protein